MEGALPSPSSIVSRSSSVRRLLLVTGNPGKLAEARRIVAAAGGGVELESVTLDLPEIQSLDFGEVLEAKLAAAREALPRADSPIVVEEAGLELAAMNGFPGPLVKWMLDAVGAEGIARTAQALGNVRARAVALLAWSDGARTVVARGEAHGELVHPPRGTRGFGFDPIFRPEGETRTFGELADEEKDALSHRGRAWRDLLERLWKDPGGRS